MVAAPERTDVIVDDVVSQFVTARGGNLPIRKILIANNGMAATKSILSMRQWAYMQVRTRQPPLGFEISHHSRRWPT